MRQSSGVPGMVPGGSGDTYLTIETTQAPNKKDAN